MNATSNGKRGRKATEPGQRDFGAKPCTEFHELSGRTGFSIGPHEVGGDRVWLGTHPATGTPTHIETSLPPRRRSAADARAIAQALLRVADALDAAEGAPR